MTRVAVISTRTTRRSLVVCEAMVAGIRAVGDACDVVDEADYPVRPDHEVAVFYGLGGRLRRIFQQYREAGLTAVYIDLGWWMRKEPTFYSGYHKFAINSRHPTAYFQKVKHHRDRFDVFGLGVQPRDRLGDAILLAGMGDKAATVEGFVVEEWERKAIARIREFTDREIIYRPKPSWKSAAPIEGTTFSHPDQPLDEVLVRARAVVTHHSNVAVDAQVIGIPTYSEDGVASVREIGVPLLERIETWGVAPVAERRQWLRDIAYQQWNVEEMTQGLPWRYLRTEGLVP